MVGGFKRGLVVLGLALGYLGLYQGASAQEASDGFAAADCPPEARTAPFSCKQVERAAYALATRKKGYLDLGGNGIPDVMERPYVINRNDCSTGNAHVACMYNDPCTAPFGKVWGLRSTSARHATVMFEGTAGNKFECDFTPGSSGIFIANRPDTRIGPAFPDPGESMDSAYNCVMNGANTKPLNAFGGSGGGFQTSLAALLMMMMQQQQLAQRTPPPADLGVATPVPTLAPTPEAAPARAEPEDGSLTTKQSKPALDAMEMPEDDSLLGDSSALGEEDSLAEENYDGVRDPATKSEMDKASGIWDRDSRDVFGSGKT